MGIDDTESPNHSLRSGEKVTSLQQNPIGQIKPDCLTSGAPLNLFSVTIFPELSSVMMTDRNDSQNYTKKTPVVRKLHNPFV